MAYTAKKVNDRYAEIVRLKILGMKNADIARLLNCSNQNVHDVLQMPVVREQLAMLQENRNKKTITIMDTFKEQAGANVDVLIELRDDDNMDPRVRASIAQDMLDRAGYGKVQMKQVTHEHKGQISSLIQRVKERTRDFEEADDAEYDEIEPKQIVA